MYVDDEEALVFLMTRMLTRSGYRVTGFIDPAEALQTLRQAPQDFDVVVTDVAMPGMSGFHLARAMLELRPDLPIVMTSGYVRPTDREAARNLGVRDLILKPDTVEELTVALEKVFKEAP
jgi:CheY-like chemotaxis protein